MRAAFGHMEVYRDMKGRFNIRAETPDEAANVEALEKVIFGLMRFAYRSRRRRHARRLPARPGRDSGRRCDLRQGGDPSRLPLGRHLLLDGVSVFKPDDIGLGRQILDAGSTARLSYRRRCT
jgi:hypothetical protein